jgi:hypothetical protein
MVSTTIRSRRATVEEDAPEGAALESSRTS